jgi:hypothetical protein
LRLELFSHKIQPALFESRLLDDFDVEAVAPNWYLVYRVQNETSPHQRRFLNIYQVSERVCEESSANANLVTTIETLCWPALHEAMKPSTNTKIEKDPLSPGLDLLCAATYLNLIPLAKRLLQEGHRPTCESHLFSSPMRLAAWAGNADMMKLFQENLPEYDEKGLRDSLMGVAIRGDIKLARLATYPPSRATPDSTDIAGQQFGNMDRQESAGNAPSCAQWSTRDIEVYQYFESFFAKPDELNFNLTKHARLGNLEMTRYLLDAGADIRGTMGRWGNPLCVSLSFSALFCIFYIFSQKQTNSGILACSARVVDAMKISSASCLREGPTRITAAMRKEYRVGTRLLPQQKQVAWLLFVSSLIMVST